MTEILIRITPHKVPAQDLLMDFEKWENAYAPLFLETKQRVRGALFSLLP